MMKNKAISLLVIFLTISLFAAAQTDKKKVAVFDPTGLTDPSIIDICRETIINTVVSSENYIVLEREKINQVLRENKYQESGNVDDSQASELGRQMGANYVCITTVRRTEQNKYFVSIHMVDVKTAQTISSGIGINEEVYEATSESVAKMIGKKWVIGGDNSTDASGTNSNASSPEASTPATISGNWKIAIKLDGKFNGIAEAVMARVGELLGNHLIKEQPEKLNKQYLEFWGDKYKCDYVLSVDESNKIPMGASILTAGVVGIAGTMIVGKKVKIEFIGATPKAKMMKIKSINMGIKKDANVEQKAKEIVSIINQKLSIY